jgi:hypothetical protein
MAHAVASELFFIHHSSFNRRKPFFILYSSLFTKKVSYVQNVYSPTGSFNRRLSYNSIHWHVVALQFANHSISVDITTKGECCRQLPWCQQ